MLVSKNRRRYYNTFFIPTVDSWSTFLGSAMYNITPEKLTKTNKMKIITTVFKALFDILIIYK